jgi:hypothetical protein
MRKVTPEYGSSLYPHWALPEESTACMFGVINPIWQGAEKEGKGRGLPEEGERGGSC